MKIIAKPVYVAIAGILLAIGLYNISNYIAAHKVVVIEEVVINSEN
jgi:hypothetical protein